MYYFDLLEVIADREPHPAAFNMALDEILLKGISVPTLRFYRWLRPSVSFGYFENYQGIAERFGALDMVRRWTGGGTVLHGQDFTYSLIIPRDSGFLRLDAGQSYLAVHREIVLALRESGLSAHLVESASNRVSGGCFQNPVKHDVLLDHRKVAGAAQRRTKSGLLHQGSVQCPDLGTDFADSLAKKLAVRAVQRPFRESEETNALALAAGKYGTMEWLRRF